VAFETSKELTLVREWIFMLICPVDLTRKLVQIETVNPPGNERRCVALLEKILTDAGFVTRRYEFAEGRTSLIATCSGGRGLPICFTGHLDTVPIGSRAWSVDPFEAEIIGDKLYGRGSSDMKSGVAAFVCAAINLANELRGGPGVVLVLTASEETGCQGAQHLASLDGVLGDVGAVVVGEMTANYPLLGHKGALWLDIQTEGITAHGSTPENGVNAVYRGAHIVTKLENFGFNVAPHHILGSASVSVGTFTGGVTTNTVPDSASVGVDVRTIPGMEHSSIKDSLAQYLGDDVAVVESTVDLQGVLTNPDNEWVREVFATVRKYHEHELEPKGASYFTDASVLKNAYPGAPIIILGPGEPSQAHRTDEYCYITKIQTATKIYQDLMRNWAEGRTELATSAESESIKLNLR
jgi:succinyl-diaminopimelate desuccinylase